MEQSVAITLSYLLNRDYVINYCRDIIVVASAYFIHKTVKSVLCDTRFTSGLRNLPREEADLLCHPVVGDRKNREKWVGGWFASFSVILVYTMPHALGKFFSQTRCCNPTRRTFRCSTLYKEPRSRYFDWIDIFWDLSGIYFVEINRQVFIE